MMTAPDPTIADEGATEVPDVVGVTMFLSDGEVVGNAGCNSYFSSYEIDETSLAFAVPFGATQVSCEGPAHEIEDAYLLQLQATAGWSVDEEGRLTLTDADDVPTLVYGESPVEITATDIDRLAAGLVDLQQQIDGAEAEIAALSEQAASVNVNNLRDRIKANEQAIADIDKTIGNLRDRIKTLEGTAEDHEDRISTLESGAAPCPSPAAE